MQDSENQPWGRLRQKNGKFGVLALGRSAPEGLKAGQYMGCPEEGVLVTHSGFQERLHGLIFPLGKDQAVQ